MQKLKELERNVIENFRDKLILNFNKKQMHHLSLSKTKFSSFYNDLPDIFTQFYYILQ